MITTQLMISSRDGDIAGVRSCLEEGDITRIDIRDGNCMTALIYAVVHGHSKIAELLIEKGASLDIRGSGATVLMYAVMYTVTGDDSPMVELLIEKGASLDMQNEVGDTPLIYAVADDDSHMVELLLEKGASLDIQDEGGNTALMCCAFSGYSSVYSSGYSNIGELLIEKGASLDIQDNEGETALTISQERGREDMVGYIMEKKVLNAEGRLVLARAIKQGFKGLPYELGLYDQIQSHL